MSRTKTKTASKANLAKAKTAKGSASKAQPKKVAASSKNAPKKKSMPQSKAPKKAEKEKKIKAIAKKDAKKAAPKKAEKQKSPKKNIAVKAAKTKNDKKTTSSKQAAPAKVTAKQQGKKEKADTKSKKEKTAGIVVNQKKQEAKAGKSKRGRKKKGSGDDDDEPMLDLADDLLLKDILETVKPNKKNQKEVKQIRTFVNPISSLTVAKEAKKKGPAKEPKGKFELEYVLGTSPGILYEFLSTPSGLSEWFADDVNIRDGIFTFFWDGSEQKAFLLDFKEEKYIRFQWMDKPEGSYFEFKIEIDDLTNDVSLIVTDFADEGSDLDTSKRLWDSQIHTLMHVIGSY